MKDIAARAMLVALEARIVAASARMVAMGTANGVRAAAGLAPAYNEEDFDHVATEMDAVTNEAVEISHEIEAGI